MIGASLLNTITESLYDDPIVVFREYVQNSVDSFNTVGIENLEELKVNIKREKGSLLFVDNGAGIKNDVFYTKMVDLGISDKKKEVNIGYKGIGRLAGLPYCDKLIFTNIVSYKEKKIQRFTLDGRLYKEKNNAGELNKEEYESVLKLIGQKDLDPDNDCILAFFNKIEQYQDMFEHQDTGFCVELIQPTQILLKTIERADFLQSLEWLLPVQFDNTIYNCDKKDAFSEIENIDEEGATPIRHYKIIYNNKSLVRPFTDKHLREHVCLRDFEYGIGLYSFNDDKIEVDKKNPFTGIKVYLDNMLLCDENELISALERFDVLQTSSINEMILSSKCIGALIYITDKGMISANARRKFIEVSDSFALEFLANIATFVKEVYDARYALSKYQSAINQKTKESEKIQKLEDKANEALANLARQNSIKVTSFDNTNRSFDKMSIAERKTIIRKEIVKYCNGVIKEYIDQLTDFEKESVVDSFKMWLFTKIK